MKSPRISSKTNLKVGALTVGHVLSRVKLGPHVHGAVGVGAVIHSSVVEGL
jgi:hypothetical protein